MKLIQRTGAQGDMLIIRVNEIPKEVVPSKPVNDHYILTHSETGHHHVIEKSKATLYERADQEFIAWLDVEIEADVEHLRGFDTHETLRLPVGKYEIRRQREYALKGFRKAQD